MPSPAPAIVFSHANGFPAGTYGLLFGAWRGAGFSVHAIDRYGHDPRYPVTSNWPHLRDQLIAFIEREIGGPAWLAGHSLGGMLSVLAASRRPELAHGVLLLDAPVIAGWRARGLHLIKATGLLPRAGPSRIARARRDSWPSHAALHRHFVSKAAFARWDPRMLKAYEACGFVRQARQWTLAFDREVEARIDETLPHHMGALLSRHPLQCRLGFIGGRSSVESRQAGVSATQRLALPSGWGGSRARICFRWSIRTLQPQPY